MVEKSYLAASLVFPDRAAARGRRSGGHRASSATAVLSSGGKDSLLTFGLLREIGLETHPIYVNESGRHWFTALNAYRHFSLNVPNTARVWTNSDRLFSWMLRQLPFVRKDFQSVRSDAYPIRSLDGRGLPVRSSAAPAKARHRTAPHRRRVRHDGTGELSGNHALQRSLRPEPLLRRRADALLRAQGLRDLAVLDPAAVLRDPHREGALRALSGAPRAPDVLPRDPQGRDDRSSRAAPARNAGASWGCFSPSGRTRSGAGFSEAQIESSLRSLVENGVHQEKRGRGAHGLPSPRAGTHRRAAAREGRRKTAARGDEAALRPRALAGQRASR